MMREHSAAILSALKRDPDAITLKVLDRLMDKSPAPAAPVPAERRRLADVVDDLEVLERVKELAGGNGGENEAAIWPRLVERGLDLVAGKDQSAPAPVLIGAPVGATPLPEGEYVTTLPTDLAMLAPMLPQLLTAARNGTNPALTADFLLQTYVPIAYVGVVAQALGAPTFTDRLVAAAPTLRPYRQWCELVRLELVKAATYALTGADDETDEAGDEGDEAHDVFERKPAGNGRPDA
jgi:hypothetical protein